MWSRRNTLPVTIEGLLLDLLPAQNDNDATCKSPCADCNSPDVFDVNNTEDRGEHAMCKTKNHSGCTVTWVETKALEGEIPSRYAVIGLRSHEMAVVGTYVDPRVLPGFRYRVRTLGEHSRPLFQGRAIMLTSIGRGYGRRLTFQPDTGQLNHNNNYFWSDSCADGFALELEVLSVGDKFTVFDACHVTTGTLEVIHAQGVQKEEQSRKAGEKLVRVQALCRVEWFESGEEQVLPISGAALVTPRQQAARLVNVSLGYHARGFSLEPGAGERRTTVHGTYVDPRIATGFHYRVRRLGSSSGRWLFNGRALKLLSIGAGYAKRITFQPDKLNEPQNFFWSDSAHGDGFACELPK
ncbi:hypothetical protein B566_EDAN008680 [Ephemera danica]|nr:hypothetical protein B566_EDAN008680 [Ephemera danica]